MEYMYKFINETISVDLVEDFYNILMELDRLTRNINQKETRRHISLEAINIDGNLFPSDADVEAECLYNEACRELYNALSQILPHQKELIYMVFFQELTIVSIADDQGVCESAIRGRLDRIYKKIKNLIRPCGFDSPVSYH